MVRARVVGEVVAMLPEVSTAVAVTDADPSETGALLNEAEYGAVESVATTTPRTLNSTRLIPTLSSRVPA